MHRGVSSFVPKGQSLGEMHTRLKEPDRRGNTDRWHRDYRIRIHFITTSRCSLQGRASTVLEGDRCLQPANNGCRKRGAEYEKQPDIGASTISARLVDAWVVVDSRGTCSRAISRRTVMNNSGSVLTYRCRSEHFNEPLDRS